MSTAFNLEQSRINMVEQQFRPWHVLNEDVLDASRSLSRENFMDPQYRRLAYSDVEVPIVVDGQNTGEVMLSPVIEARLAQELLLKPTDSVLEIGTGSGFQAAFLSRLCEQILSIEIDSKIAALAQQNLTNNHINNVKIEIGNGYDAWGSGEYNAILLTGSVKSIPDDIKYHLSIGGRLLVVEGTEPLMTLYRITRTGNANFITESLFETCIPALRGGAKSHFKF